MQTNPDSPHALQDLYQAIELIDCKIAYSRTRERIESEQARESQLRKLSAKRDALVKSTLLLTSQGVRCHPQFLPQSFIHLVQSEAGSVLPDPVIAEESKNKRRLRPRQKRS
ncbi:MAG: hypothetical protein ACP5M4_04325 [Acidobacteriaceae bacterium]